MNEMPTTNQQCSTGKYKKEECTPEHKYTDSGSMSFMCKKHQQWIYEFPVKIIVIFADGTEFVPRDRTKK